MWTFVFAFVFCISLCFFFVCDTYCFHTSSKKIGGSEARVSLNDYRASVLFAEKRSVELDLDNEEKLKKNKDQIH